MSLCVTLYETICCKAAIAQEADSQFLVNEYEKLLKELEIDCLVNHLKTSRFPEIPKEHLRQCLIQEYNLYGINQ